MSTCGLYTHALARYAPVLSLYAAERAMEPLFRGVKRDTYNKHVHGLALRGETGGISSEAVALSHEVSVTRLRLSWLVWTGILMAAYVLLLVVAPSLAPTARDYGFGAAAAFVSVVFLVKAWNLVPIHPQNSYWPTPVYGR